MKGVSFRHDWQIADELESKFKAQIPAWEAQPALFGHARNGR